MSSTRLTPSPYPNVIGTPGGSLHELARFANAANIESGRDGERRTAEILRSICIPGGPTVLHDLDIPMSGLAANIDHIVVSGHTVRIIDSKMWKPGFYWTLFGHTRNGLRRVAHADKQTMTLAQRAITTHLRRLVRPAGFRVKRPLVVIWPSSRSSITTFLYRPVGAKAVTMPSFRFRAKRLLGTKPADPAIIAALVPLLKRPPSTPSRQFDGF
jgi:hypothetical protein